MPTKIEWAEESWNPVVGCAKTSPGCANCYAEKMAFRLAHMALADIEAGRNLGRKRHYLDVVDLERKCWNGKIAVVEEALTIPLHWRKPRTVFVCSMSDLFHEDVGFTDIADIMQTILLCQEHAFIILTKRAERMLEYSKFHARFFFEQPSLPDNVIGMVTAENQKAADERLPLLAECPFTIRGVSIEPMLGPMDISGALQGYPEAYGDLDNLSWQQTCPPLGWAIVGGETGPGARPMCPQWVRSIRDQCQEAGVAFFFKAWGSCVPAASEVGQWIDAGWDPDAPKHGRVLDGREWNETPTQEGNDGKRTPFRRVHPQAKGTDRTHASRE